MQNQIKTLFQVHSINSVSRLGKRLLISSMIISLSACATQRQIQSDPEQTLKAGYARISFQEPNRVPNLFKEKLFGRLSSLSTESGITVELTQKNSNASKLFVDVMPGTYEIKAECDPVKNYSGDQTSWLTSHTLTVKADQVIKFGCEYYTQKIGFTDDDLISQKSVWPDEKSQYKRKARRVRLFEIDSEVIR